MGKTSFIMYKRKKSQIAMLSDSDAGRLFKAIYDYQCDGTRPEDAMINLLLEDFIVDFTKDDTKYEEVSRKRAEVGKKGAAQRWSRTTNYDEESTQSTLISQSGNAQSTPQIPVEGGTFSNCHQLVANDSKRWQTMANDGKCGGETHIYINNSNNIISNSNNIKDNNNITSNINIKDETQNFENSQNSQSLVLSVPPATPKPHRKKAFIKPTLEEITQYCKQRNSSVDPELFFYHYEARDWYLKGDQKMQSWKSEVIVWEKHNFKPSVQVPRPTASAKTDIFSIMHNLTAHG